MCLVKWISNMSYCFSFLLMVSIPLCTFCGDAFLKKADSVDSVVESETVLKQFSMMQLLNGWLNGPDAISRLMFRRYVMDNGYTSVLDVGCGLCFEYYGFAQARYAVDYCGVEPIQELVDCACSKGISCVRGSVERLMQEDDSVDVVYARHVLEYLSYYEQALSEMLRVAKKAVVVMFAVNPDSNDEIVNDISIFGSHLYHNKYNRDKIEQFVRAQAAIARCEFLNHYVYYTAFETMLVIEKV